MKIMFYTGPQCSLCDLADIELANTQQFSSLNVEKVNIRNSTDLYHLYGARIPVLKREDNGAEIGWPFDTNALETFLQ
ncbi:glutaredoxin family protein [Alteromonas sp. CI.11.F.A3]|uniref:glutaredoxin family protein n=1 Tax=Alteromonas sp. CI.11.F.A3 TaxID=3079555 RepID=UPI0029427D90|nr:glutaredoxin family protein [Alteromonas sp. CI.11.F.A3]WOI35725.1 glutaredoxin family protein [Alteromonas sp. CI.11.F.A3]